MNKKKEKKNNTWQPNSKKENTLKKKALGTWPAGVVAHFVHYDCHLW